MGKILLEGLKKFHGHPIIGEIRGVGLLAAVEFVINKEKKTALSVPGALGSMINNELYRRGLICRAMGDTVAICPPLIINEEQIVNIITIFSDTIDCISEKLK